MKTIIKLAAATVALLAVSLVAFARGRSPVVNRPSDTGASLLEQYGTGYYLTPFTFSSRAAPKPCSCS